MTPMWQVVLAMVGIMASLAVLGIVVESKKRDNFREYWWARLSAWAGANADAHHYRKDRHAMYYAAWMSRVNHKDGELEPWGASTPRVVPIRQWTGGGDPTI